MPSSGAGTLLLLGFCCPRARLGPGLTLRRVFGRVRSPHVDGPEPGDEGLVGGLGLQEDGGVGLKVVGGSQVDQNRDSGLRSGKGRSFLRPTEDIFNDLELRSGDEEWVLENSPFLPPTRSPAAPP